MGRHDHVLRLHRELDHVSRAPGGGEFLSGWQTRHPFAEQYLPRQGNGSVRSVQEYTFLSDSSALTERIRHFHRVRDGVDYSAESIYPSNGSSALLMAYFLRLRQSGVTEAWFVPPVYYSCYYFADSVGITLRRIDVPPLYDPDVPLDLPAGRTVLLLSDPIWVLGAPVHTAHLQRIAEWQRRTGSEVLVDGTFQYTAWGPAEQGEGSAHLDPERTFRIVCPTKSTAVHGVRFAYLLLPPEQRESIRYPAANLTGANGVHAEQDAVHLMEILNAPRSNLDLRGHIAAVHRSLHERGVIVAEAVRPSVTYYTFARLDERHRKNAVLMDQRYFDLVGFDDYVRINLLHPGWFLP